MKVLYVSDGDLRGSGYSNIGINLCKGLVEAGHEVKYIALGYDGSEHWHNFSLIPANNFQEVYGMIHNLRLIWKPDILVVALDIPMQEKVMRNMQNDGMMPYVSIFPLESGPLCMSWAMVLLQSNAQLCMSKFGVEECRKAGVEAREIPIGIDMQQWREVQPSEKEMFRKGLGYAEDAFVVLTVAMNQERKNLSAGFQAIKRLKDQGVPVHWALVTTPETEVGWKLYDLLEQYGLSNEVSIYRKGLDVEDLWGLYAASDVFMLPSKAEGLGMPVLEAMAVGLPVVGTDCAAIKEHLSGGRGFLAKVAFEHQDVFGNSTRYYVDPESLAKQLYGVYSGKTWRKDAVRKYIQGRTWDKAVKVLNDAIEEVINGKA